MSERAICYVEYYNSTIAYLNVEDGSAVNKRSMSHTTLGGVERINDYCCTEKGIFFLSPRFAAYIPHDQSILQPSLLHRFDADFEPWGALYDQERMQLVLGSRDNGSVVWLQVDEALMTANELHIQDRIHEGGVFCLKLALDGSLLVTSSDQDGLIKIWNAESRVVLRDVRVAENSACWCMLLLASNCFYSGHDNGQFCHIDADTGAEMWPATELHHGRIRSIVFNDSNNTLITASDDNTVKIHNSSDMSLIHSITVSSWATSLSLDGDHLYVAIRESGIFLYHAHSLEKIRDLVSEKDFIFGIYLIGGEKSNSHVLQLKFVD